MNTEEIKSYLESAKGPVYVHLSDGRRFLVEHLDYLLFHRLGQRMFLFNLDGSFITINRQEIISLEERK